MKKALFVLGLVMFVNTLFAQQWITQGNNIFNGLPGFVGIGGGPNYPLDVYGIVHTTAAFVEDAQQPGAIGAWIRGASNGNANLVLQGRAGNDVAFWLTAGNGMLKIGSVGDVTGANTLNMDNQGHLGINTTNTAGYMFAVAGSAIFTQAVVKLQANWPDYVFHKTYHLPSLDSVEAYIRTNNHLPGMPSAEEVSKNGIDLGANQAKLLEKIEQLTLYTIQLQQQVDLLKAENDKLSDLQHQIDELKKGR